MVTCYGSSVKLTEPESENPDSSTSSPLSRDAAPQACRTAATVIRDPGISRSRLLPVPEALQEEPVSLAQAPFKLLFWSESHSV